MARQTLGRIPDRQCNLKKQYPLLLGKILNDKQLLFPGVPSSFLYYANTGKLGLLLINVQFASLVCCFGQKPLLGLDKYDVLAHN